MDQKDFVELLKLLTEKNYASIHAQIGKLHTITKSCEVCEFLNKQYTNGHSLNADKRYGLESRMCI